MKRVSFDFVGNSNICFVYHSNINNRLSKLLYKADGYRHGEGNR